MFFYILINVNQDYSAEEFVLAWKFNRIISLDPEFDVTVYIDANTGELLKQSNNIVYGQAQLSYGYGSNVYIDTRWRGGLHNHHVLRSDDAGAPKIWTKAWMNHENFGGYNCIPGFPCTYNSFDTDNIWQADRAEETTPHWLATHAWHYYNNTFGRLSYDGNGSEVKILADAGHEFAGWLPEEEVMMFGNVGSNHLATKDLVGHEFTHGVVQYTADLVYEKEPGALNESFADIFGYDFERYLNNGVHTNWDIGEDAVLRRRMNDPLSKGNPAFYKGLNWVNTDNCTPTDSNDNCGVHKNSGVQNYWFYLLTDGSAGAPNGTYNNTTVNGIGPDKARDITYYSLANILGANSAYPDARNGAILAAMSLYGECSNELTQTINAWAAVGLNGPRLPLTIEGPDIILYSATTGAVTGSMPKTFSATNGSSRRYDWTYSGPWTYVVSSTNFKRRNEFSITNFNNSFSSGVITVTDGCSSVSKTVHFLNTDNLIVISPNPVLNIMNVSVGLPVVDEANPVSAAIYDLSGNLKFNGSFDVSDFSIDVSSLPVGNYYLNIEQGDYSGSKQFLKQ